MTLRILMADDHELIRHALASLLSAVPDFEIVASVADGERALEQILALRPDVAVLDLHMPGLTGIEVARRLRDAGVPTAVVILSLHGQPAYVRAALDAGASGYVLKEAAPHDLVNAVRATAAGEAYVCPKVARVLTELLRSTQSSESPSLTPAQLDVLRLLAQGLASKEIAAKLHVAIRTVDSHRAALMERLGIHHIPGLVKYALRNHLTTLDE